MAHYDYIIVGAGLFGATFAYFARQRGYKVLLLERRDVAGGNLYCRDIEGINVHAYGAHIFHTSNPEVWELVTSLVPFNRYTNCPVANYKGRLFNLPFNMNTFYNLWGVTTPDEARKVVARQRAEASDGDKIVPSNLEEQAILLVGEEIYRTLIKGYTEKQWGRSCRDLPAFVIRRLPLRWTFDNNYFNDKFQGIPEGGYNILIRKLTEGCEILTGIDYLKDKEKWDGMADQIVFTGQIDEYFGYCYGQLEYRTVRFETEILDTPNFQGNAVVNYTDAAVPYTRVIEHKHFEVFGDDVYLNPRTVISREYSAEWRPGIEPFYPVNNEKNTLLYQRYKMLADKERGVIFGGRLAEYSYYDMDKVIERCMEVTRSCL